MTAELYCEKWDIKDGKNKAKAAMMSDTALQSEMPVAEVRTIREDKSLTYLSGDTMCQLKLVGALEQRSKSPARSLYL